MYLEQGRSISDVVSDGALTGDSDFVFVYRIFRLRFLDLLIPIHGVGVWRATREAREGRKTETLTGEREEA